MQRAHLVGEDRRHVARRADDVALQRGQARQRLDHVVVGRHAAVGTLVVEALAVAVHQPRVDGRQRGIVDAHAHGGAAADRMHEHVRAGHHRMQRLAVVRQPQVEHDAALVAIAVEEHGRHAGVALRSERAGQVAVGRLDLDHVGPHVAQELGGQGAQNDGGDFEHLDAVERAEGGGRCRGLGH
jgi:hypothetical protein